MAKRTAAGNSEETITINVDKFLMPISLLLSAIVLSAGLFFGLNNIATSLKNGIMVGGTTTTTDPSQETAVNVTLDQIKALFNDNNIAFGSPDNKVLFVEFGDPSCPYCHIAGGKNPELNKQVGAQFTLVADGGTYVAPVEEMRKLVDSGQASFVWLYTNGHGNGELATQAQYCAHEKGKFWEVHDLLMTNAGYNLINDTVRNDVANAGKLADFLKSAVDPSEMKSCLESGKYAGRIAEDQATGSSLGVRGTPNFFVNTMNYGGAYSYNDMKATVEAYLNS